MKRYICLSLLMFSLFPVFAQFDVPMQETCEKFIKRKLLVVLFDTINGNDNYNAMLKRELVSNWKYSEVEFADDMPAMYKKVEANPMVYAVIEFMDERHAANGYITAQMANQWLNNNTRQVREVEKFALSTYIMQVILPEQGSPFMKIGVQNKDVSASDVCFWVMQLNVLTKAGLTQTNIFSYAKNLPKIQASTVYFNEDDFSESGKKYLEKNMKYPYKLVSEKEYNKLVLDKKEGTYYFKIITSQEFELRCAGAVIDASTGRIMIRTSHIAADCKTVYSGPPTSVVDMNGKGMCAKHLVNTLYDESTQARNFRPNLTKFLKPE